LTRLTYPNGKTVTRPYDDAGQLATISDWLGNTTTLGRDKDANPTSIAQRPTTTTQTWDAAGRLASIVSQSSAAGTLAGRAPLLQAAHSSLETLPALAMPEAAQAK
jgi:YD repeat-containing protein